MEALLEQAGRQANDIARVKAVYRDCITDLGRVQMNCPAHGVYMARLMRGGPGKDVADPCMECIKALHVMRAQQRAEYEQRQKDQETADRIDRAGVPQRFRDKALTDYRAENDGQKKALAIAADFVERFRSHREKGASLVFAGLPGTGKSLLAMLILQEVCRKGFGGRYTTCQSMIQAVRRTWGKDGDGRESDVLDGLCGCSLLVIDEIGVQSGTENEKALLFEVIDRRYADMRPTILATNLTRDGFKEFVGDRIWDRLTENARWVPFAWESYRPIARREMAE